MFTKIVHITLALFLFIGSSGIVLNKHYCQNELKSMALFFKAKPCYEADVKKSCPMHSSDKNDHHKDDSEKDCCDDQTELLKTDEDQLFSSFKIDLPPHPVLLGVLMVALNIELSSINAQSPHYLNYKPPLIVYNLPVSLQTFLC